jgi:hypothetical protein
MAATGTDDPVWQSANGSAAPRDGGASRFYYGNRFDAAGFAVGLTGGGEFLY